MNPSDVFQRVHDALNRHADLEDPGDAGTIYVDRTLGFTKLVSGSSAETRTLANPVAPGIIYGLFLDVDGGGDITLTVTDGYNKSADTTLTFADAGDCAVFYSTEEGANLRWRLFIGHGFNAALTAAETTLTNAGTASDYAIQALTSTSPFGFVTQAEGETVVEVVLNNQARINEIETALQLMNIID